MRWWTQLIDYTRRVHTRYEQASSRFSVSQVVQIALLVLLVLIYALGIWGMVSDHAEAKRLAAQDLLLQTQSRARALEAALASSRSDFFYLTQSAPFVNFGEDAANDPVSRRWNRLDVEAAALLFLAGHAEVERIQIWDGDKRPYLVAGRREGAPTLLPPALAETRSSLDPHLLRGLWPLGNADSPTGSLEAFLDGGRLLELVAPDAAGQWRLSPQAEDEGADLVAEVHMDGWIPDSGWTLQRQPSDSPTLGAALLLSERHRSSTILSLGLMTLAVPLGWIALRQLRRNARLEVERIQQDRIQQLERQLWHNERLTSLGRLAAGMAHEINNPLEGMANYLGIVCRELQQRNEEELLRVAARLREGLDRVANIVGQVLTFSDPGKTPMEPVDLVSVLTKTFEFVRGNPEFRHLAMTLTQPESSPVVSGNPVMLGQLFLNLMLNACQLQSSGGEVDLACSTCNGNAIVAVSDRGPGISAEHAEKLFEPFFSGRGSTGLGLSVCLGIVTLHGGTIKFQNRAGGGAVMTVSLPLRRSPSAPTPLSDPGVAP